MRVRPRRLSGARSARRFRLSRDIAPSIVQDMRYASARNFTGRPVPGYDAPECVLKREAAEALKRAQEKAQARGLSLEVYDCYRPERAVRAFLAWAASAEDGLTKSYYPHLQKSRLVPQYIAPQSTHSTGLAVDITLIPSGAPPGNASLAARKDCTETGHENPADKRSRYGHGLRLLSIRRRIHPHGLRMRSNTRLARS